MDLGFSVKQGGHACPCQKHPPTSTAHRALLEVSRAVAEGYFWPDSCLVPLLRRGYPHTCPLRHSGVLAGVAGPRGKRHFPQPALPPLLLPRSTPTVRSTYFFQPVVLFPSIRAFFFSPYRPLRLWVRMVGHNAHPKIVPESQLMSTRTHPLDSINRNGAYEKLGPGGSRHFHPREFRREPLRWAGAGPVGCHMYSCCWRS